MTDMIIRSVLASWMMLGALSLSFAGTPGFPTLRPQNSTSALIDCEPSQSSAILEANNVRTIVMAGGDLWWTVLGAGNAFYEVPRQDDPNVQKKHSLFAGSMWMGGRDENTGELLVLANTYRQSHYSIWTGPIENGAVEVETCKIWDRHFSVTREEIESFREDYQNGSINDPQDIPESILHWPGKGNPHFVNWPEMASADLDQDLAPYVESMHCDPDGIYDPMTGDFPDIIGDQGIWWVMNDVGNAKEFGGVVGGFGSQGGAIQVEVLAFGIASNDCRDDATFYKYRLKNKGVMDLDSTYFGLYVDSDLGNAFDDYVEVDVPRGLAFTYNGDDFDEGVVGYGENPPSIGFDFFIGPKADLDTIGDGIDNDGDGMIDESDDRWIRGSAVYEGDGVDNDKDGQVDEPTERISMSDFLYYYNDNSGTVGNPGSASDFFNFLRSTWRDGTKMTYDFINGTNQNSPRCHYMFPGSSDLEIGWGLGGTPDNPITGGVNQPWDETISGNMPSDRRMLGSAGPFSMSPGEIQELIIGVPWAKAESGGPKASVAKLKFCDDEIQSMFPQDGSRAGQVASLNGPNSPDFEIIEGDNDLIIRWEPSDFSLWNEGIPVEMNTESYSEASPRTNSPYKFQGYRLFQLRDASVDLSDLGNADLAREIAVFDLKDGVTKVINYETDHELGLDKRIPILKVEGSDNGIRRSFQVKEDLFASGSRAIVNHRKYYFTVMAYAYNSEENDLNFKAEVLERKGRPYLESQKNIRIKVGIPHLPIGENIPSQYGQYLELTRLNGIGNGGHILELKGIIEREIFDGKEIDPVYSSSNGPIKVMVSDPRNLKEIRNGRISLSSRLVYQKGEGINFLPGDTIISLADFKDLDDSQLRPGEVVGINDYFDQVQGIAVVKREIESLSDEEKIVLEIDLLNEVEGGTFTKQVYVADEEHLVRYEEQPALFALKGKELSFLAEAIEFFPNDLWTIKADDLIRRGTYPLSYGIEESITEIGISIIPQQGFGPGNRGGDLEINKNNGFLEANIEFEEPSKPWFVPVSLEDVLWQEEQKGQNPGDTLKVYQRILDGGAGPYAFGNANQDDKGKSPFIKAGVPLSQYVKFKRSFRSLNNVDLVLAPNDPEKWTRVGVIQFRQRPDSPPAGILHRSAKSSVPSVGKDGLPDGRKDAKGNPSLGWSWFPGYAIDLDKGERIHFWITESIEENPGIGNDLLWNPDTSRNAAKHFLVFTNRKYDFDQDGTPGDYQVEVDELFEEPSAKTGDYGQWYADNFTWNLYLRENPFIKVEKKDRKGARVRLRVQKEYLALENGSHPEFGFSTIGLASTKKDPQLAQDHLKKVGVVPNPYYAYSQYEESAGDRRIKITNLPANCRVSIFTLNGTLVRQFQQQGYFADIRIPSEHGECETPIENQTIRLEGDVAGQGLTSIDWDLKNGDGNLVGSGVYLIHIDAGELGNKVVKFFCIGREGSLTGF